MLRELTVEAKRENTGRVIDFVSEDFEKLGVPDSVVVILVTAVEEIYLNIAGYAYEDGCGDATIRVETVGNSITLTFIDSGIPFDPLKKEDPDLSLPIEERPIGGLGVLLVKKTMDEVDYQRKDEKNILTLKKSW